jgi:hypothetical protein
VCPSGSCSFVGEPSKPSSCVYDDCSQPAGIDVGCVDTVPIDGEGECDNTVTDHGFCSVESGHPQRLCFDSGDCGGGACEVQPRKCFLTGPFTPYPNGQGTGNLTAQGAAAATVGNAFAPTLAAVWCEAPTSVGSFANSAFGLPGPARETMRVRAIFDP